MLINGGYGQGRSTARRVLPYSERCPVIRFSGVGSQWPESRGESVRQFSTAGRVSGPNTSLHPFFYLQNVAIKAVKTDLPFISSFFIEYA